MREFSRRALPAPCMCALVVLNSENRITKAQAWTSRPYARIHTVNHYEDKKHSNASASLLRSEREAEHTSCRASVATST